MNQAPELLNFFLYDDVPTEAFITKRTGLANANGSL
jgi:hypothetical protein